MCTCNSAGGELRSSEDAYRIWDKVAGKRPEHVYEFVDGCASQFKGAPSFADIADSKTELGYFCTRYFHEVSHAKGPQDAAGANIKATSSPTVALAA